MMTANLGSSVQEITVNGRDFFTPDAKASYDYIVRLAGGLPRPGVVYTVTYHTRRKGDEQRAGTLAPGQSTEIEDRMVFDAVIAGNA